MNGWISICGWRRFQHYDPAKRQPPWVKVYTELLDDEDYLSLTETQRAALHGIWLAYAKSRCQLSENTASLSSRLRLRITRRTLDSLVHAGFIDIVASKTLAEGYHDASARAHVVETETETETEEQTPPTHQRLPQTGERVGGSETNGTFERLPTEAELVRLHEMSEEVAF